LVGAAAAAVIATKEEPRPPVAPGDPTGDLVRTINELKDQISALDRERRALIGELDKRTISQRDVVELQRQLVTKDQQIQSLVQQVSVLQTGVASRGRREAAAPSQS